MSSANLDLGARGKAYLQEVLGPLNSPLQNRQPIIIENITGELDELEEFGMSPERLTLLQDWILAFGEKTHSMNLELNEKKKRLQKTLDENGASLQTLEGLKLNSKFYIKIRDQSDVVYASIDRMRDYLTSATNQVLDDMEREGPSVELTDELKGYFEQFDSFRSKVIEMLQQNLNTTDEAILEEETNFLWYLRGDLESKWAIYLDSFSEDGTLVADKLCNYVDTLHLWSLNEKVLKLADEVREILSSRGLLTIGD